MDFSYTEEQEALRELARKILEAEVTHERLKEIEASEEWFDRKVWSEFARANLLGVPIPDGYGGMGLGFFELCLLLEEVGRAVAPLPVYPSLVLGAFPLIRFGSEEQKTAWLPRVARGEAILSAALVEPGSDEPLAPTTRARRVGRAYSIDGIKTCVPVAPLAERVLVPAATPDGEVGIFLVNPRGEGVTLEPQRTTRGDFESRMTLTGVSLEPGDVVGSLERGAEILRWLTDRAIVGLCAAQVGVSERALRMTAEYTSSRIQFDRPVGSFQAVHQRAANAYIDVEAMRLTTWQAAWRLAEERPAAAEVAVAKVWAAEGGHAVGYAAQHLHGGIGVDVDYPVHRYTLWSKHIELSLGSATRQLARLGGILESEPTEAPA
jgi:alkylation response protein AidB-like acyl-CoA dehydrogenase